MMGVYTARTNYIFCILLYCSRKHVVLVTLSRRLSRTPETTQPLRECENSMCELYLYTGEITFMKPMCSAGNLIFHMNEYMFFINYIKLS